MAGGEAKDALLSTPQRLHNQNNDHLLMMLTCLYYDAAGLLIL